MAARARSIGMILLGIWLVIHGILTLTGAGTLFPFQGTIMGLLALVAGILILLGR